MSTSPLRRHGARSVLLTGALVTGLAATMASPAGAAGWSLDGTIQDSRITESSGLARSTYPRDTLFTHNDSGDGARVFAVDPNGKTRAVITLSGVRTRDWEDIAAGPDHTLWVGDIGDNRGIRDSIAVHRFVEPATLGDTSVNTTTYQLTYPDGRHNAEGLMVHPVSGRVYVVTKKSSGAGIYAAPSALSASGSNRLTRVASAPSLVKAASFAADGSRFVLSAGGVLHVYKTIGGTGVTVQKPSLKQGESAAVTREGGAVIVGSEGANSPLYRVTLS
jgi:hypothetical protein